MTRALLASLLVVLCACSSAPAAGSAQPVACTPVQLPISGAGDPPAAVLQDVAGPTGEYFLGVPGKAPIRARPAAAAVPVMAGGKLWLSRAGSAPQVQEADAGSCRRVAGGLVLDVAPHSAALLVATGANSELLLDPRGRRLATLPTEALAWLADGSLVAAGVGGITVYRGGHPLLVTRDTTAQLVGTLGTDRIIVVRGKATRLVALSGSETLLADELLQPAAGSPDGRFVAGFDPYTNVLRLFDAASGRELDLPGAAAVTGLRWSSDSEWLAVSGRYGGSVVHVSDQRLVDLGSLNVASW